MLLRLPAEWEAQDAVLFAWPDESTDWATNLESVRHCYVEIFRALCPTTPVILLVRPTAIDHINSQLSKLAEPNEPSFNNLYPIPVEFNDTWARDFGPITRLNDDLLEIVDFQFNAWGEKFEFDLDNNVTKTLFERQLFNKDVSKIESKLILEGGGIESDGLGNLLTTCQCLLNANRNPELKKSEIESNILNVLGGVKIHWISNGEIIGDDTDSHIDTLARFAPNNKIIYQSCDDKNDRHYASLTLMENELQKLSNLMGEPFDLIPLPLPGPKFDNEKKRLPATYANFLISNGTVLVPTYQDDSDALAISQIGMAFPDYQVIGINCLPLIEQHGSLHCISMQLPQGSIDFSALA